MSQAQQIFQNTSLLALAKILERVSSIVLVFLVARALGASALGVYAGAIAFYGLFAVAGELGASNMLVRDIARDRSATTSYLVHLGAIAATVGGLAVALAWAIVPWLDLEQAIRDGFLIVTLAIVPATVRIIQEAVFVAHQRVEFQTAVTFVTSMATIAATAALVATGQGVSSLLGVFVGLQWFVMLAYFGLISRFIAPVRAPFRRATAWGLLKRLRAFAGMSVLAALFAQPELLILAMLSSSAKVGFYAAAFRLVIVWQVIPQTFMVNVFPVLSRAFVDRERDFRIIPEKAIKYLLAATLPISAGLLVAADPIVRLLFGTDFASAVDVLRILALSIPVLAINSVLWRVLVARDRQRQVLGLLTLSTVMRLAATVGLVLAWGAIGAAIAAVASLTLYSAGLAVLVRRDGVDLRLGELGERFALATVAMAALTWVLVARFELWVVIPAAALTYAVLVWVLRAFSSDDVALFRRAIRLDGARGAS